MIRIFTPILVALLVVGCNANPSANRAKLGTSAVVGSNSTGTPVASALSTTTLAVRRTLDFEVRANSSLADGHGKIINSDPAGIVAAGGGNIVAAGGGNIVAAGGGNVISGGGGSLTAAAGGSFTGGQDQTAQLAGDNFAPAVDSKFTPKFGLLATSQSNFTLVSQAVVHAETVDGVKISNAYITSGDDGRITLSNVPDTPLLIVAQWKENGQVYKVSMVIGTGAPVMRMQIDPINHFVQARIRALLKANGKIEAIASAQLAAVWGAFNDGNIPLTDNILKDDATLDDLNKFYAEKILQLPTDKQCIVRQYMSTLGAPQPSTALCPTTAATGSATAASGSTTTTASTAANP
jgi:hypothetical protein